MSQKKGDVLFKNFRLVDSEFKSAKAKTSMIVNEGLIEWIGNKVPKAAKFVKEIDLKNDLVFPSFIECHTHSVFAGSRAEEFELRNNGVSYLEIAQKGGGILSTVKATRAVSFEKLLQISQKRVDAFTRQGVSTLEIKSGYALDLKNEIKMLQVAKKLKGPRIISTFLGAHAKPKEFASNSEYLEYLIAKVLPEIMKKKLAERIDIFIENKFFEKEESEKYLKAAVALGFDVTIHANQLSISSGVDLAVQFQAQSADHVIKLNDQQIKKIAGSRTVAVLLPTADLYMKCDYPRARELIDAGAMVALATDFNPGTAPSQDLSLVGLLARLEMKMTLPEVFKAYTIHAAHALGLQSEEGQLVVGKAANFISTKAELADFFYSAGSTPEHTLFIRGMEVKTGSKNPK